MTGPGDSRARVHGPGQIRASGAYLIEAPLRLHCPTGKQCDPHPHVYPTIRRPEPVPQPNVRASTFPNARILLIGLPHLITSYREQINNNHRETANLIQLSLRAIPRQVLRSATLLQRLSTLAERKARRRLCMRKMGGHRQPIGRPAVTASSSIAGRPPSTWGASCCATSANGHCSGCDLNIRQHQENAAPGKIDDSSEWMTLISRSLGELNLTGGSMQ